MNDVLTDDDLVLLRAALQFWSEELEPHGPSAWQPYLDRSISIRTGSSALISTAQIPSTALRPRGDIVTSGLFLLESFLWQLRLKHRMRSQAQLVLATGYKQR
ncbi:hypothetical protein [Rubinisphaera margarita]|uniref:hypothetical protein n=1 Tax=Rubinisphaera margarita TaxID=2909586 RepID=UPI001EE78313|nr:hypothetical protein [Rubinisphaera margarita]MCG6156324.1 hypothetical protein [Rubinisphaera margarita]